jgi:DNA-binding protein HU-beta
MATTKVNRTQLIEALAVDAGVSKTQAERFLNSFVGVVTKHLKKGSDITVTGFGSFRRVKRNARKGVNPKTRQPLNIPASFGVSFKVGKTLKEAVK